ncbi:PREDICTED: probable xyloglucan endotransglucosylase/hydrolase protein 33 [Tarenaya hassleriana]|uniref:probable xyloglucan endotransglucosylase/hydrolase protein 33 n=1 Tax=Tarenaya hassleriana TaxID=28532 RepID=UPI00053C1BC1|nr:PREDICTED: probable xyloglucan endotransglucosylase/hydrolase protein 33 [Tarenaya hassleriana]
MESFRCCRRSCLFVIIIRATLVFCLCSWAQMVSAHSRKYTTPNVKRLTDYFSRISIDEGFSQRFGTQNIQINGTAAKLTLDKTSGAGLVSKSNYHYGFFSAKLKLPAGFASGVVVAFYLSNAEKYPKNHDEIDIEILGRSRRDDWVVQTNVYANGSLSTGREEKFYFWFDPTQDFHYYSVIWNTHHILFLIDNIPVREFPNRGAFTKAYPSKPMSLYVTVWDGSEWATHGGKYPVNYKYGPFVASIADVELNGCSVDGTGSCTKSGGSVSGLDPVDGQDFATLSKEQITAMDWARRKLMFYSYCSDKPRYKVMPSECR